MLNADGAARYLGISYQTFNDWKKDGAEPPIPAPVERKGRKLYLTSDLEAFVAELVKRRGAPKG